MLIILTGKSGAGKTTIEKYLIKEKGFEKIITYTTRPKRKNEKNGNHYYFVNDNTFSRMKDNGNFFETVDRDTIVNDMPVIWHYGSLKRKLDVSKDYCIVLDYEGAEKYVKQFGISNCFIVDLQLDEKLRKERVMRRNVFSETEWQERCKRDNEQFDRNKNIINFALDTFEMSIQSVTSAVISALEIYKKNIKRNYQKVIIRQELRDTIYWEQPEIVYIPDFEPVSDSKD